MTAFTAGWYNRARRVDAHAGRMGGAITATSVVVHTTDCMPGTMPAIVKSWSTKPGNGACAHFVIGRDAASGIVQMVPINRNGNHAGGAGGKHGWYKNGAALVHPNTMAIGIELDCAGYLGKPLPGSVEALYRHRDSGLHVLPENVDVDARGVGWHKVTPYQYGELEALLTALDAELAPLPAGIVPVPNGGYKDNGVMWAEVNNARVVGHVTLDPTNKTDPGPAVMDWIRKRR